MAARDPLEHELAQRAKRLAERAPKALPRLHRCRFCGDTGYVVDDEHADMDEATGKVHRRPLAYPCPDPDCERRRAMRGASAA